MSFQSGSNCYETAGSALSASVSSQSGGVYVFGSPATTVSQTLPCGNGNPYCTITTSTTVPSTIEPYITDISVNDTLVTYKFTGAITGTVLTKSLTIQPQQCQLVDYQDSFILSGLVISVWFIAWAMVVIRKTIEAS